MILGIDASAITAGCALCEGEKIIAEQFMNTRHTHSQTLQPMIESMLKNSEISLCDVDKIAVSVGPGSFTGLRIAISVVKGMAYGAKKPCVEVSTLEAIAQNLRGISCTVCCAMDARCSQVYNALFKSENGIITRLSEDRAIRMEELYEQLKSLSGRIILVGDGAELLHAATEQRFELAPSMLRYQRGSGVCFAAMDKPEIPAEAVMPSYLRLPQAERERLERLSREKESK